MYSLTKNMRISKLLKIWRLFFSIIPQKTCKNVALTGQCSPLGLAPPTAWPKGRRDGWRTGGEESNKHGERKRRREEETELMEKWGKRREERRERWVFRKGEKQETSLILFAYLTDRDTSLIAMNISWNLIINKGKCWEGLNCNNSTSRKLTEKNGKTLISDIDALWRDSHRRG